MKKIIPALVALLLVVGCCVIYFTSNLSRDSAMASFAPDPDRAGMNTLTVRAPFGYYVIDFSVVPKFPPSNKQQFRASGIGIPANPIGLYGGFETSANFFPSSGTMENIPADQIVQISKTLNPAGTAELPTSQAVRDRCGLYVYITRDKAKADTLKAQVASWTAGGTGNP